MSNPKSPTIKLLAEAIGDGNIKVHFRHINTQIWEEEDLVRYIFEVNGVRFETGWHNFLEHHTHGVMKKGRNEELISRYDINSLCWFVEQYDTKMIDPEQRRREAQATFDKAMNSFLGTSPF